MSFTHLHVATSSGIGSSSSEELAAAASRDGATSLACTDHDGLYGAVKHLQACLHHGLQPVLGVNLAVVEDSEEGPRRRVSGRVVILAHGGGSGGQGTHVPQGAGYRALCRLVSDAHAHTTGRSGGKTPVGVTRRELAARAVDPESGLPVLTVLLGPESDVGLAMYGSRYLKPRTLFKEWLAVLPTGTLAAELVSHPASPKTGGTSNQPPVRMLKLAREHRVPAILSNAVRHLGPEQEHDLPTNRPNPPTGAYLKTSAEMTRLAHEIVYAADLRTSDLHQLLGDTEKLAERCRLDPSEDLGWTRRLLPEPTVLGVGQDAQSELAAQCEAGMKLRFPGLAGTEAPLVQDRLQRELDIIGRLGFAPYFLTVAEVARTISGLGVRATVRGTAVSSLVNHLLGISPVNPLRHGLLFEQFLLDEPARSAELDHSLPNIAFEVDPERSREVHQALFKRFGRERTVLVGTRKTRQAPDDGISPGNVSELGVELPQPGPQRSMDPCGIIVGDAGLLSRTPVQPGPLRLPLSQFGRQDAEALGLMTVEIRSAPAQRLISHVLQEIGRHHPDAAEIDIDAIPLDDGPAFALIGSADSLGCFQDEMPGQREFVGAMAPRDFTELVAATSICRPGPVRGTTIPLLFEHRHGFTNPDDSHPDLQPVLAETHGMLLFHEQVLRIFDIMTGCGLSLADQFRRALPDPLHQDKVARYFAEQAAARGYPDGVVREIWKDLRSTAGLTFSKANGVALTLPGYQAAWLKAHHPEAFLSGLWEHEPERYPRPALLAEARRMGVPVLPLDVNRSSDRCRTERIDGPANAEERSLEVPSADQPSADQPSAKAFGIRRSLTDIPGLSGAELARLLAGQPYASLEDLHSRAELSRTTIRRLAESGALDSLHRPNEGEPIGSELVRQLQRLTTAPPGKRREQMGGQLLLPLDEEQQAPA
ncbi:PHP domain-containing protein [Arthrobacter sp. NPDC090010]|uniref:PHP domain-containing protein n=1 Tax=Arthrobacter sp. NPDC090010 TaxID=3363942 RepID=UPI00380A83C5